MTAALWNRPTQAEVAAEVAGSQTRALPSPPSAEILQANDLLTQGVLLYKQVMEGRVSAGPTAPGSVGNSPVCRGACESQAGRGPQNILGWV